MFTLTCSVFETIPDGIYLTKVNKTDKAQMTVRTQKAETDLA